MINLTENMEINVSEKEEGLQFEELLIDEVEKKKMLYDKSAAGYRNKKMKEKIWLEISQKVGKTVCECEGRWATLRQRFSRELKKQNLPSGSGSQVNEQWVHYHRLLFLKDYIKQRRTTSNSMESSSDNGNLPFSPSGNSQSTDSFTFDTPHAAKKRKTDDKFDEVLAKFEEKLQELAQEPEIGKTTNELFMRSILYMMSDLPQQAQDIHSQNGNA